MSETIYTATARPMEPPLHRLEPAPFGMRLVALLIDGLVTTIISGLLAMLTGIFFSMLIVNWLYYAGCESSRWQATIGKKLLGLIVVTEDYQTPTFARASGRFFGKLLSSAIFGVGYIMAAFTERRQALHDIIARCLVLQVR